MGSQLHVLSLMISALAGAVVPFQAAANGQLGRALGHPLWATFASLLVSIVALVPLLLLSGVHAPQLARAAQGPAWIWVGGLAGLLYVSTALFMAPRIGVSVFIVAAIAGQTVAALAMDQFGLAGLPCSPISAQKAIGAACVIVGFVIFSKA